MAMRYQGKPLRAGLAPKKPSRRKKLTGGFARKKRLTKPGAKPKPKPKVPKAPGAPQAPAASAPTAPQAPGPYNPGPPAATQLPWNAQSESEIGLANRNYNDTDARLTQEDYAARSEWGFDKEFASNPLTRANLLKKAYDSSRLSATNSMASRGQLYSGATSNALGYADFNNLQNTDKEMRAYQAERNRIQQDRLSATRDRDESIAAAHARALEGALGEDPDSSQYLNDSQYNEGYDEAYDETGAPIDESTPAGKAKAAAARKKGRVRKKAPAKKAAAHKRPPAHRSPVAKKPIPKKLPAKLAPKKPPPKKPPPPPPPKRKK